MLSSITAVSRSARRLFWILLASFITIHSAAAQQTELVVDVRTGIEPMSGLVVESSTLLNDKFILSAFNNRERAGYELYEFDPATGTNRLLADLLAGDYSSSPKLFTEVDSKLYFIASTNTLTPRATLHRYDPVSGEVSAVAISNNDAPQLEFATSMMAFDGHLVIGGSQAGQAVLAVYSLASSTLQAVSFDEQRQVRSMLAYNGELLLVAPNFMALESTFLYRMTSAASTPTAVTINSPVGTLGTMNPFIDPVLVGDTLFFSGRNDTIGEELFSLDLSSGIYNSIDLFSGATGSNPREIYAYQDTLYFGADDPVTGRQLLHVFGPNDGSPQKIDVTFFANANYSEYVGFGEHVFFRAFVSGIGGEPYRININTRETEFLGDYAEGGNWSSPGDHLIYQQQLYTSLSTFARGENYHRWNEATTSFELVGEGNNAPADSFPSFIIGAGDSLFFQALSDGYGSDIYRFNLTSKTLEQITRITDPENFIFGGPTEAIGLGDDVYFGIRIDGRDPAYYRYNLTSKETTLVTELTGAFGFNLMSEAHVVDGKIYFVTDLLGFSINDLGVLDPQAGTVTLVNTVAGGLDITMARNLTVFNGKLYFSAVEPSVGHELFAYDPQSNEINALDINVGSSDSYTQVIGQTDSTLYLQVSQNAAASDPSGLYQLDVNGTVKQLLNAPQSVSAAAEKAGVVVTHSFGNTLSFYDLASGELTTLETGNLETNDPGIYFGGEFIEFDNQLLIVGSGPIYGQRELFNVDVATKSVSIYAEVRSGPAASDVFETEVVNNQLYFTALRPDVGYELFTIVTNQLPTINGEPLLTIAEGQPYSFIPTANDPEQDQLTFSISGKPSWADFDTSTGALTGTPGFEDADIYPDIIISVSDGGTPVSLPEFDIEVTNSNRAPTISGTPLTSATQDVLYQFDFTISDPDAGDELSVRLNDAANKWLSVDGNSLLGTPTNADVGVTNSIILTVRDSDGAEMSLDPFIITVANVNDAPTISGTPLTEIDQDAFYSFQAVGADVDLGDELTYVMAGHPNWLSIDESTGEVSGTPTNDDVGPTGQIFVGVRDLAEAYAALDPFTITVNNVNDAPTISGTPLTKITAGQFYSFTVVGADIDVGDQLTYSMTGNPLWLSIDESGLVSGTPTENDLGTSDSIEIRVTDLALASASLPAFTIEVLDDNQPPMITTPSAFSATQGQPLTISISAVDEDPDSLLWTFDDLPTWLSVTQNRGPTATVTGTPDQAAADQGVVGLSVAVTDNRDAVDRAVMQITVADVNIAPVFTTEPLLTATQDVEYSLTLTATDDDGDDLSFGATGLPGWLTLEGNVLSGTPLNADVGIAGPITLTVSDPFEGSAVLTPFSIVVANVNDAPVITNIPASTATVGQTYRYVPTVTDVDTEIGVTGDFSFSIDNMPSWMTFDEATGALTGTPTADNLGEDMGIIITVTDAENASGSVGPFTIEVKEAPPPPEVIEVVLTYSELQAYSSFDDLLINAFGIAGGQASGNLRILESRSLILQKIIVDGVLRINRLEMINGYIGTAMLRFSFDGGMYKLTIIADGQPLITLTTPDDITVYATGTWTEVDLNSTSAKAVDVNGKTLAVNVEGLQASYTTGLHTVLWSAGAGANKVSKAQTIRVIPRVSFQRDLEFAVGSAIEIPVVLSGQAPEYPYTLTAVVSGAEPNPSYPVGDYTVTFIEGTEATLTLPAFSKALESITVLLENRPGELDNSGTLTSIKVSAPAPTAYAAPRLDEVIIPATSVANQGSMLVQVKVSGGVPGEWQIAYRLFNPGGIRKFTALRSANEDGESSARVQFGGWRGDWILTVTAKNDLRTVDVFETSIRVRANGVNGVNGINGIMQAFEYSPDDEDLSRIDDQNENDIVDYDEGRWDYDGNGISAYLDRSSNISNIWTGAAFAQTQVGKRISSAVENSDDPSSIRMTATPVRSESPEDPIIEGDGWTVTGSTTLQNAGMDISDYRFFGDFYAFRLSQLFAFGATAQVSLPLDEPLGAGSEFLLWQDGAWRLFEVGAGGALYSASSTFGTCPTVDSAAWQPGLNEGHWCVRLDIVDGGVNDTDGEESAEVLVFGGAAINDAGNSAPVAVADTATAVWRGSVTIPVLANDTDADNHALSILSASVDIGTVTVNAARNAVQYTAAGDFAGTATITYVVSDNNGGVAVGTATVTVLANRAPVLGADTAVTVVGRPVTVNVLANDSDPDGDTLSLLGTGGVTPVGAGAVSHTATSITFTPAAGFIGQANVQFTVSDGRGGETVGSLVIQVAAAPEVIEVRPATGTFSWWLLAIGGLLLAGRRRR